MTLRQRSPVTKSAKYLKWIRTLPCCICNNPFQTEAAHIRSGSLEYGKEPCGMQERNDSWVTPLCNRHHREQHESNELEWWESKGQNPFELAKWYWEMRPH